MEIGPKEKYIPFGEDPNRRDRGRVIIESNPPIIRGALCRSF